ncbi:electron transfer flavoprotein subunit alpha/FixB family protein [Roseivirga sp. E12]|uniref:electron transfer flavoprotein subunit alpha/FixB family protein n=1 Tax=Roseivirga sp. E12 TaxID=2819237 RepID=UPI001ABC7FCE|nr:electron transfer flavoprotein subunit alpha/FixB family protein [Roseivirga sp. E12]MBO3696896.1 electron transfer flavoprotein subunit alpha/FixB family protein [Roseivirga sp. E12]
MSVLVFIETEDGKIKKSSREAISYGAALGDVTALALGTVNADELATAGQNGASKVLHVADERLNAGLIQPYAAAIAAAASEAGADVIVTAKSSLADAVVGRVSMKLGASLVSNVVSLPDTSNGFQVKRSIYTGKAFANVNMTTDKKVLAIKKNAVEIKEDGGAASVEAFSVSLDDSLFGTKITSTEKAEGDVLLPEADIVVSGGRGLKGPENWGIIEDLAKTLGAATGCSKPVSDMDWRPHHEHVGQTGVKVSPTLYVAVGISGAIQHLAGVNSSKYIVVINKDEEAPFFKAADYGIVGDAFEVLPKLNEALKAAQ